MYTVYSLWSFIKGFDYFPDLTPLLHGVQHCWTISYTTICFYWGFVVKFYEMFVLVQFWPLNKNLRCQYKPIILWFRTLLKIVAKRTTYMQVITQKPSVYWQWHRKGGCRGQNHTIIQLNIVLGCIKIIQLYIACIKTTRPKTK